jgi:hypothetical protein
MNERMDEMKRTDAEHAEKTYFLRSHYAAWQEFIRGYPEMLVRWKAFLGNELLSSPNMLPGGIKLDLLLDDDDREPYHAGSTSRPAEDDPILEESC